jgi:hypothetical protein
LSLSVYTSLYHSGVPIDSIPHEDMSDTQRDSLWLQYQT